MMHHVNHRVRGSRIFRQNSYCHSAGIFEPSGARQALKALPTHFLLARKTEDQTSSHSSNMLKQIISQHPFMDIYGILM